MKSHSRIEGYIDGISPPCDYSILQMKNATPDKNVNGMIGLISRDKV